ncbi:uncharacterized protein LOC130721036 [Lotus japonicus]|uniref:uncharacterized protein LOC130721036 n=1 Tax=Lotus japonicus TaxID=34305 RepID=UPI00258A4577|nr:uncharacterized protein LOC130721036 [Lotus japonicus]
MSDNSGCSVYIGNLDERVTDRVLYDILIQAGRVVDLHIPKDKESEKPKGFAFAEYETEEVADYAVRLFSGLVTLYNRTLKFAISGKDKTTPNGSTANTPSSNSSQRPRLNPVPIYNSENFQHSARLSTPERFSDYAVNHSQVPPHRLSGQSSGYGTHYGSNNYEYSRRALGATLDSISRSSARSSDRTSPITYPSY